MQIYERLYDQHRLDMRVRGCFHLIDLSEPAESLIRQASEFRARWAIDPDLLRADAVKIFADGVIEYPSQTAALLEPYLDAQGHPTRNRGPSYFTQDNLNRIVSAADAADSPLRTRHRRPRSARLARWLRVLPRAQRRARQSRSDRPPRAHRPGGFPALQGARRARQFPAPVGRTGSLHRQGDAALPGPERSRHLYPARSCAMPARCSSAEATGTSAASDPFEAMEHAVTRAEARTAKHRRSCPSRASAFRTRSMPTPSTQHLRAWSRNALTGSLEAGKRSN